MFDFYQQAPTYILMTQVGEFHPIDLHNLVANLQATQTDTYKCVITLESQSNGLLMQFNLRIKLKDL